MADLRRGTDMLRYDRFEDETEEWRARFSTARPFPHLVLHDVFHHQVISQAVRDFPGPDEMAPKAGNSGVLELADSTRVPHGLRQMSEELLGLRFTAWLSSVTGIDRLKTDPVGSWGALRQSGDGVEGRIHVPPAHHPDKPWYRRLTLILHLTEGLTEANGGCFQLWDSPDGSPRTVIPPLFNSAVVFLSLPSAFHNASRTSLGPGQMRRVMQALYYTENPPGSA